MTEIPHFDVMPRHIGFIMDGNGRWAKMRGLERWEGHAEGAKTFHKIGEYCADLGIEYVTFYAFSTENWNRPQKEVSALMQLFVQYLSDGEKRLQESRERQMRLRFLGDRSVLPPELVALIEKSERETAQYDRIHINIALNYGGRDEITRAVRKIAQQVKDGALTVSDITEQTVSDALYTAGQPDPDVIARPSGEKRMSNFLTWQSAYSELWFSDVLWPDFSTEDVNAIIRDYASRHRRFGGV